MFHHVGISVSDLEAMAEWYSRALQLTAEPTFALPEINMVARFMRGDGFRIELVQRGGSVSDKPLNPREAMLRQGIYHFCLEVDRIDLEYTRLVENGARVMFEPSESPNPGERFAIVSDPEGNFIELIERHSQPGPRS